MVFDVLLKIAKSVTTFPWSPYFNVGWVALTYITLFMFLDSLYLKKKNIILKHNDLTRRYVEGESRGSTCFKNSKTVFCHFNPVGLCPLCRMISASWQEVQDRLISCQSSDDPSEDAVELPKVTQMRVQKVY